MFDVLHIQTPIPLIRTRDTCDHLEYYPQKVVICRGTVVKALAEITQLPVNLFVDVACSIYWQFGVLVRSPTSRIEADADR